MCHLGEPLGKPKDVKGCPALNFITDQRRSVLGRQKPDRMFCSSFQIEARSVGHTVLTVSVRVHQQSLQTSATFAAYEPLKVRTCVLGPNR